MAYNVPGLKAQAAPTQAGGHWSSLSPTVHHQVSPDGGFYSHMEDPASPIGKRRVAPAKLEGLSWRQVSSPDLA